MSFIINKSGSYLGEFKNGKKDIIIVFDNFQILPFAKETENKSAQINKNLLSPDKYTPLVGSSKENPGYQFPISIKEEIWQKIETAGGQRPEPIIVNNSYTIVYIKAEDKVLKGPGQLLDHKTPIALPPGGIIYGRIDGVNTPRNGHQVFKAVDGTRLVVLPSGKVKIVGYEKWISRLGQLLRGGWKDRRKRSSWLALSNSFTKGDLS